MGFIVQWLWYLLAFVLGSLVAWVVTVTTIKHTSAQQAFADLPDAPETGARR